MSKWLTINADRTVEVWENYRRQMRAMDHSHVCPDHGRYRCPWITECSVKSGTRGPELHCPKCIMIRDGISEDRHKRQKKLKMKQIKNKRDYRQRLQARPTNKVARGIK